MKTKREVGIYCHLPFCVRKCAYCDFYSGNFYDHADRYIDALLKEADFYKKRNDDLLVTTLYLGGGTPSSLSEDQLSRLLSGLKESFESAENVEITLEANPATLTKKKLSLLKDAGVNRLSIGAQSANPYELSKLGRLHSYDEFVETYIIAKEYFDNISVDLMFGLPGQTVNSFQGTLNKIISIAPCHISLYALKIEEGTPFFREQSKLSLPSEDDVCVMYLLAHESLSAKGYHHYEISNYAKQGSCSKHNLGYWLGKEYIGLGAAAHSYFNGARYANVADIYAYITALENGVSIPKSEYSVLNQSDRLEELIILSLRLTDGLDCDKLKSEYNFDIWREHESKLKLYIREGYMNYSNNRLSFTPKGFLVSNSILSELMP